jgi:hypothetical protein
MIATNLLCAKAKRTILNVSPAGCGKSASTDVVNALLKEQATKYTSLTLAGMTRIADKLTEFSGHLIIDDLGSEKSIWSRTSTITVLATLVHTHNIHKITQTSEIMITNFQGSAALNIQPVLLNSLVQDEDWIAVIRDKVLRYYHLIRPVEPKAYIPTPKFEWGAPFAEVRPPKHYGKLWYQLITEGLTQWSYARCIEHIPALLKASAALDNRYHVEQADYQLLIKLLRPMQLERYILTSYGFEYGRTFQNDTYCLLVELASHGEPSVETICEDYKVSPSTVERLVLSSPDWCFIKANSPKKICAKEQTQKILNLIGVNQKW